MFTGSPAAPAGELVVRRGSAALTLAFPFCGRFPVAPDARVPPDRPPGGGAAVLPMASFWGALTAYLLFHVHGSIVANRFLQSLQTGQVAIVLWCVPWILFFLACQGWTSFVVQLLWKRERLRALHPSNAFEACKLVLALGALLAVVAIYNGFSPFPKPAPAPPLAFGFQVFALVFTAWVGRRLARLPGAEQPVARSAELDTPGQLLLAVCGFGLLAVTLGGIFFWFACQKPEAFYVFGLLGAGAFAMGTAVLLLIGGRAEPPRAADLARRFASGVG